MKADPEVARVRDAPFDERVDRQDPLVQVLDILERRRQLEVQTGLADHAVDVPQLEHDRIVLLIDDKRAKPEQPGRDHDPDDGSDDPVHFEPLAIILTPDRGRFEPPARASRRRRPCRRMCRTPALRRVRPRPWPAATACRAADTAAGWPSWHRPGP